MATWSASRRARPARSGRRRTSCRRASSSRRSRRRPDSFRDLEAGNVVGVINDKTASVEIVKDLPALEVVQDIDTNEHYGLAFSPSNPDLREAVNAVFAQMVADGTYATIFGKYFPPDSLPPEFAPTS